ncbi:MAG: hypothetical protein WC928_00625 [Patescibacteria group bacterium]|jgi:hypothetical protein
MSNKTNFLISGIETGKLNAMVKNVMLQTGIIDPKEAVRMMNAGELQVSLIKPRWREKDGIIYFSVTSDGTTGEEWIARLEGKGFRVSDYAKKILCSKEFKPTSGVTTEIAVLKGLLFEDSDRITRKIRAFAVRRKFKIPNSEVACLIREVFSDKELEEAMGLTWIAVMHKSIKDSNGDLRLLRVDCLDGGSWLSTNYSGPGRRWNGLGGFAFALSQISS